MAKGLTALKEMGADVEARKNAAGGSWDKLYFNLDDGETAVVRFLEDIDDAVVAWVHELPPRENQKYGSKVVCRDQDELGRRIGEPCPGCEKNLKRKIRGAINVVWRNAPVYEKDENGSFVRDERTKKLVDTGKTEDQVALWSSGKVVFIDTLLPLDEKYSGLTSRDFEVTKKGVGLNTTYIIFPADVDGGKKAMSKDDKKLAEDRYDLSWYEEAPPYDEWGKSKKQQQGEREPLTVAETSVFMRGR